MKNKHTRGNLSCAVDASRQRSPRRFAPRDDRDLSMRGHLLELICHCEVPQEPWQSRWVKQ